MGLLLLLKYSIVLSPLLVKFCAFSVINKKNRCRWGEECITGRKSVDIRDKGGTSWPLIKLLVWLALQKYIKLRKYTFSVQSCSWRKAAHGAAQESFLVSDRRTQLSFLHPAPTLCKPQIYLHPTLCPWACWS